VAEANINLRAELENNIRFHELIANLSAGFILLPAEQVDSAIQDAIRCVCELLGIEFGALAMIGCGTACHYAHPLLQCYERDGIFR